MKFSIATNPPGSATVSVTVPDVEIPSAGVQVINPRPSTAIPAGSEDKLYSRDSSSTSVATTW